MEVGSASCAQVASALNSVANLSLISASHFTNGSSVELPDLVPSCANLLAAKATSNLCRVVVNVATGTSSVNRVEAWLPDNWNGRLLATGTGGIGGCIDYTNLQYGASFGFATVGTNSGHDGSTGYEFFLNHPDVVEDFGYRGIHVEAEIGKQIVQQYYGVNASYNYYTGCSTGGRQGYQEAILYPHDFDGILIGSMGVDWLHIVSSKGILARRLGWPDLKSPSYVSSAQWSAIVAAQIKLLDPLDGVVDGIIDNPTVHRFDPQILACGTGVLNDTLCLTPAQVATVSGIYQPLADSSGQIVYPAFDYGADTSVFSSNVINNTAKLSYTILQDYWRGAVYNSTTWTPSNFSTADMDFAVRLNPGGINIAGGTSYNVSGFHDKGGKLLAYHGRKDPTVTSGLASRTWQRTADTLNLTADEMHKFFRLFYIPGMQHCSGGPGAWNIGQPTVDRPTGAQFNDTDHNVLLALVKWVEEGVAPDYMVGTKFVGDHLDGTVQAQRMHCVYPNTSRWDGVGDTTQASSWRCELDL